MDLKALGLGHVPEGGELGKKPSLLVQRIRGRSDLQEMEPEDRGGHGQRASGRLNSNPDSVPQKSKCLEGILSVPK